MDIYEFAFDIEKKSEMFYRDLAEKCNNNVLKKILNMLADEEIKHYNTIKSMKEEDNFSMKETDILKESKKVFSDLKDNIDINFNEDLPDLLQKAIDLELRSKSFYFEKAEEVSGKDQKIILLKLVDEEEKHYFLLENLVEFLSRPKLWVENAEFYHLDEY